MSLSDFLTSGMLGKSNPRHAFEKQPNWMIIALGSKILSRIVHVYYSFVGQLLASYLAINSIPHKIGEWVISCSLSYNQKRSIDDFCWLADLQDHDTMYNNELISSCDTSNTVCETTGHRIVNKLKSLSIGTLFRLKYLQYIHWNTSWHAAELGSSRI